MQTIYFNHANQTFLFLLSLCMSFPSVCNTSLSLFFFRGVLLVLQPDFPNFPNMGFGTVFFVMDIVLAPDWHMPHSTVIACVLANLFNSMWVGMTLFLIMSLIQQSDWKMLKISFRMN